VFGSAGLEACTPDKQDVQEKRQLAVLPHPSVISDWQEVAPLDWKFKDERVVSHFDGGTRRIIRR
jgi:hypothetical protein